MMKTLKTTLLAGIVTAMLAMPAAAATTLLSDNFNVTTSTKGFDLDTGVNFGINPPHSNRITGTVASNLRYLQTTLTRSATKYGIANNRLRVETENTIGRFTLAPYNVSAPFDFGPALGVLDASPADPVVYDLKISMQNNATGPARFSFAIGTVESDANNWDFGVQLYHAATGDNFYSIRKRIDTGSSGLGADINELMTTTGPGTNVATMVNFLIRVTDAGPESSTNFNSRIQVSLNNGATWIYDTASDPMLPNGFRFDGPGRFLSFDQASNSSGNVLYDNLSITWHSGPRAWDGGGTTGNWNDALNWGGAVPTNGSRLTFSGTQNQSSTNNFNDFSFPSLTFNNGGFAIHGNSLSISEGISHLAGDNSINNSITLAGPVTILSSGGNLSLGDITGSGQNLNVNGNGDVTINSAITTAGGALIKAGAGTLTLAGENTYTGPTTISAGTLALEGSGSIEQSSSIAVSSGATLDVSGRTDSTLHLNGGQILTGDGSVNGNASISGTLAPGLSVGSFTTGSQTWNSGGQIDIEIASVTGTPGVDWDSVVINGTLDIAASRSTPFVINLSGAAAAGFDNSIEHSWDIVTTSGGILNFDPASVIVAAPGFDTGANGGFGVRVNGNNLQVFFGQKPAVDINNPVKVAALGDLNVEIGGDGTDFSITSGSPILGYQWKRNGVNLTDDANISGSSTATLTFSRVSGSDAGDYSIEVWNAAGSTVSDVISFSVTKAGQHIVYTTAPEQNYGDSVNLNDYFISKDNSETPTGVALTYSLDSGGSIASINNGILTFTGVGTVTVRASAPETADYTAGDDVTGDITAGTRTLTIQPDASSRAYGDENPTFTVSFSGFAFGETLGTSDVTGAESVTASSPADGTTIPGEYTITVDLDSLAGLSSSHYDFTTADGTLTITNRALYLVANPASKTFGDSDPVLTWTTNGFVNGDENLDLGEGLTVLTGTPTLSREPGENAGTYTIFVDASGVTVNTNLYVLQATDGLFTINKATPTVTVYSLTDETYNGTGHPTSAFVTGVGGADLGTASVTYTPGGTSAPVDAGEYDVEANFDGNDNYTAATGSGTIHIARATVDPIITVANKTYDGTAAATIASRNLSGVFGSDDVTLVGGTAAFQITTAGLSRSVLINGLSLGGSSSGNYELSSTSAEALANIDRAPVNPQITADDKSYDGTISATIATRTLLGVIGTDDVVLSGGTATFDTPNAGSGKTVTAVDLHLAGTDSENYELTTTTAQTTADITPAMPVITWGPLAPIPAGTPLASMLNASADVPGTFSYFENSTPVSDSSILTAGTHTLTARFEPSDTVNYSIATLDRELEVVGDPDDIAPILKVVYPKPKMILPDPTSGVVITGLVTEVNLASIQYKLNDGEFTPVANLAFAKAGKPTNWWDTITSGFRPGTNHLVIKAIDLSGNEHKAFDAPLFWHVTSPLTIEIKGQGTVVNKNKPFDGNNTNLFVGRTYSLSSKVGAGTNYILSDITYTAENPAESGTLFVNTGAAPTSTIQFTMKTNMHIIYNFVENPAYTNAGNYFGLFHEEDGYKHHSAGFAQMKLTPKFKLSGKLSLEGHTVAFTCALNLAGTGSVTVDRTKWGKTPLDINLAVDFHAGDRIFGTVTDPSTGWTSELTAHRATWDKLVNTADSYTNKYTMVIPGFDDPEKGPIGYGYNLLTVNVDGTVKAKGAVSDGASLKVMASKLSKQGDYPFYARAYKNVNKGFDGGVMGWLQFTGEDGHKAPNGELTWIKTTGWTNYLDGLTNSPVTVEASCWTNPPAGIRAIELSGGKGIVTVTGADIEETTVPITLGENNKFVATPALVKATVAAKTGLWKGSFVVTGEKKAVSYIGVFLQDQNYGRGFFIRPSGGGMVKMDPAPVE